MAWYRIERAGGSAGCPGTMVDAIEDAAEVECITSAGQLVITLKTRRRFMVVGVHRGDLTGDQEGEILRFIGGR